MAIYRKGIKGKLDALFSLYIRIRDKWTCRRCHKPQPYKSRGYHCAHFKRRGIQATCWDPTNAVGLDHGCHKYLDEHPAEKKKWFIAEFGEEAWEILTAKANTTKQWRDYEIADLIKEYEAKISALTN